MEETERCSSYQECACLAVPCDKHWAYADYRQRLSPRLVADDDDSSLTSFSLLWHRRIHGSRDCFQPYSFFRARVKSVSVLEVKNHVAEFFLSPSYFFFLSISPPVHVS